MTDHPKLRYGADGNEFDSVTGPDPDGNYVCVAEDGVYFLANVNYGWEITSPKLTIEWRTVLKGDLIVDPEHQEPSVCHPSWAGKPAWVVVE